MIGWGQYLMLLLVGRLFTAMISPQISSYNNYSDGAVLLGVLLAVTIQALSFLPLVTRIKIRPIPLLIVLTVVALGISIYFARFLNTVFSEHLSIWIGTLIVLAVGVAGAVMGREGIARAGSITFVLMIIGTTIIILTALFARFLPGTPGSLPKLEPHNYNLFQNLQGRAVLQAMVLELLKSGEWFLAVALAPYVRNRLTAGVYGYLGGKLLLISLITITQGATLGRFADKVSYPFFSLGAYLQLGHSQRIDSIYLLVWSIAATVYLAIICHTIVTLIQRLKRKVGEPAPCDA